MNFVPAVRAKESIAQVYYKSSNYFLLPYGERCLSLFGELSDGYYIKLIEKNNTFFNHFRLKAGITQRIFNNTYLLAGFGYAESKRFYRLAVIPYSNDPLSEVPLEKTYYGIGGREIENFVLETGLAFRISNSYLINLNISTTGLWIESSFLPLEVSLGIGYNF